ncbi:ABC transporter substrate-binding protein [Leadbettera azotonutricia]|uniref:Extracellular solute-binding protein, family 1 n=1 Tax=Leadbettera azotonutricia (strain ATCC BAA-888 / DSM 13862 / ZAS-9) TaxID=545695 RepID=F5YGG8_LEAAZ|nr:extracellular solute-binding protein [Leadbettera azotonutricia]AEF83391.1 extracellular solute-binding protein, family 1 [Leadbettera azotonutricia ZAS-9]
MKKLGIACLLVLLSAAFMLTGCSKKEAPVQAAADPNAPVTITVWCWDPAFNIFAMKEAEKIYKRDRPNVTINVVETPWDDVQQKLITGFSSGETSSLADIVLMQDNAMQKNIITYPSNFLPVGDKVDLSQFAKFKVDVAAYNGKYYGVPFDNGTTGFFIRSDIIEQAGLKVEDFNDTTWEHVIELGRIVKAKTGLPLLSTDGTGPDLIMIMLQSAGTWLFDQQTGKTLITGNPALTRAVELFIQMAQEGILYLASDWNDYIASFNRGNVAATIQGCWIIGSISAEPSQSGKWALVSTPKFANIQSVNYSSQGGSGWMVLANSKNPDVAMDFLAKTFAGSKEFYEIILPPAGAIATWLPAADSPVYSQPVAYFGGDKVYEKLIDYVGKVPSVKYGVFNYEARGAVTKAMMDIRNGANPAAALKAAQDEVDFLIAQ